MATRWSTCSYLPHLPDHPLPAQHGLRSSQPDVPCRGGQRKPALPVREILSSSALDLGAPARRRRAKSRCQPTRVQVPAQMKPRIAQASLPPTGVSVSVSPLTDQL